MAFLEIRDLYMDMRSYEGHAQILNGIELDVERGQILGLVGETGCGKSLTGLSVSQLVSSPPAIYSKGSIRLDGRELLGAPEAELRRLRGRHIGMIFQDPTTNLNPAFTIGEQIIDVILHAGWADPSILGVTPSASSRERRKAARRLTIEMLDKVGIRDAASKVDSYPHEFSGGMRQRVLIAMALIGRPKLLIADEPTTALDVSIQAQILKLIYDLVREFDLAVLLITHNLGVVAQLCTHVAVMYAGNIGETGPCVRVLKNPQHPYTRALLDAVPRTAKSNDSLRALEGSVPNLFSPPPGCRLEPRCPFSEERCSSRFPAAIDIGDGHRVACVLAEGQDTR